MTLGKYSRGIVLGGVSGLLSATLITDVQPFKSSFLLAALGVVAVSLICGVTLLAIEGVVKRRKASSIKGVAKQKHFS
jgi:hypothetical protein